MLTPLTLNRLSIEQLRGSPFPGRYLTQVNITFRSENTTYEAQHRSVNRFRKDLKVISGLEVRINDFNKVMEEIQRFSRAKWIGHLHDLEYQDVSYRCDELTIPWFFPFNNRTMATMAEQYQRSFEDAKIKSAHYEIPIKTMQRIIVVQTLKLS